MDGGLLGPAGPGIGNTRTGSGALQGGPRHSRSFGWGETGRRRRFEQDQTIGQLIRDTEFSTNEDTYRTRLCPRGRHGLWAGAAEAQVAERNRRIAGNVPGAGSRRADQGG